MPGQYEEVGVEWQGLDEVDRECVAGLQTLLDPGLRRARNGLVQHKRSGSQSLSDRPACSASSAT